ncbi:GapS4b family protein [Aeromonas veronii]|uniref:GapS4b family protein n=2 Tax=Aeromonas veronii TaxID=654 RepID=UPI0030D377B7
MNNRQFIPAGEHLKALISQSKVSEADINSVLRGRGVFSHSTEKSDTAPLLIKTIISPREFDQLKSKVTSRESSPKTIFRNLEWSSEDTLIDALHGAIDVDSIVPEQFVNYEIDEFSDFYSSENPDFVLLDFGIKRTDLLDEWDNQEKYFKGQLELKKVNGENISVNITMTHTSPETKQVANSILKAAEVHLRNNHYISESAKITEIRFNHFTNENRISFLSAIARKQTEYEFFYKEIVDFQFKPDITKEPDQQIEWLQKNIDELSVKGDLEKTIFFNEKLHKNMKAFKLVANYSISFSSYSGTCKVSFEFPGYAKKGDDFAELVVDFKAFKLTGASQTEIKEVKNLIMKNIEKVKTAEFLSLKQELL